MIKRLLGLPRAFMASVFALFLSVLTFPAHAAIDVSKVVTEINDTVGPIGLIGAAVLIVLVSIAAFRWVGRAIR